MRAYGWEAMPPSIVARALTEAVEKMRPERKPKARIAWFRHDVADAYDAWRRAVGPHARSTYDDLPKYRLTVA